MYTCRKQIVAWVRKSNFVIKCTHVVNKIVAWVRKYNYVIKKCTHVVKKLSRGFENTLMYGTGWLPNKLNVKNINFGEKHFKC